MAITWENPIKTYFTDSDVGHMKQVQPQIDLRSYVSVRDNAVLIYERVTDPVRPMPPKPRDWIPAWKDNFRRWIETGTPER